MPIYWSIASVPEVARLPKAKQVEIWQACWRGAFRHKAAWYGAGIAGGVAVVGIYFCTRYLLDLHWLLSWAITYCIAKASSLVLTHFLIVAAMPYIRMCVGGVCPACGYDLRASEGRCPECGTAVPRRMN